ncbi:hypothetical protein L9F63_013237, partial [Diploptera punctata]
DIQLRSRFYTLVLTTKKKIFSQPAQLTNTEYRGSSATSFIEVVVGSVSNLREKPPVNYVISRINDPYYSPCIPSRLSCGIITDKRP